jgi:hypothetical protein
MITENKRNDDGGAAAAKALLVLKPRGRGSNL